MTKGFLTAAVIGSLCWTGAANAQCVVQDAAQAALERELELIEALATDPADSFRGDSSCVNMDILSSLDLSTMIPDLAGLLDLSSLTDISGLLSGAQSQVCRAIQDAIDDNVSEATSAVTNYNSGLTDELNSVLSNGWSDLGMNL